jgi:hypothetical protein
MPVVNQGDLEWNEFYSLIQSKYYPCANAVVRGNAGDFEAITRCRQSKPGDVDVVLVGDSHAEHLFVGLAEAAPEKNVAFYISGGLPIEDGYGMSLVIQAVAGQASIETVIVSADWAGGAPPEKTIAETLSAFASAGKKAYITDDVPFFPLEAKSCKFGKSPLLLVTECHQPIARFEAMDSSNYPELQSAVNEVPGTNLHLTAHYFCNDETCDMTRNELLMYRYSDHLNVEGSRYLVKRLLDDNFDFRSLLVTPNSDS